MPHRVAEFFGERALFTDRPRPATVRAVSARVTVLALDRLTFETVLRRDDAEVQVRLYRRFSDAEQTWSRLRG